jgi:chromosome segregation ATPase
MFDDEDDEFDPTDIVHKSEHTIGFRGIGELQKQIREVTKELRLAEAKHKQEIERLTSAAHENHQEQNRSLKERIETLSNNFTRVSQQMSVVVKEKDYYKELSKEKDRRLRSLESEPGQFTEIMSQSHQEEDKIHIMKQEFASMKEQLTNRYHDTRVELQKVAESLSVTKRDVQYWKDKFDNAESVVNSTNLEIAALRKLIVLKYNNQVKIIRT